MAEFLEALGRQTWPHYEVLVIDDGSTDATAEIVLAFPSVCYHRQNHAGLSVARNLGLSLARGEVIAYTDDDCLPDEDWLLHLATAYDDPGWVAAGGPNIPPPPRNNVEAVVGLAPGAPAQVLLAPEPVAAAAVDAAVSANIVNVDPYPVRRVEFPGGVTGLPDLTYSGNPGYRSLKLDLYLPPAAANARGPRPVVVYMHGGGWQGGEVWSWRYPTNDCLWFQVSVGADGRVRDGIFNIDPRCDAPSDKAPG